MDIKISEKEQMYQPNGVVDVLVNGIFDMYLVEHTDDEGQQWIDDVEVLDDLLLGNLVEETDRVLFAILRQRGQDPIDPGEGIQWAESMLSEIPVPLLMSQITSAAAEESSYVNVGFQSIPVDNKPQLAVVLNTMNISGLVAKYPNV